jgi:acyl-CoA reductase-like NAD-dependent aldehyde dehydrogenase
VQEGIDTAYYAAVEGRRLFGHTVPSELRNKWAMSYRRPIGVCGIITPFNFPLAIPTWKMFPALVCGNACVFKPAEDVPHTGHVLVEILLEAGLPPEVIQLVHGEGEVGAAIVEHPDVPASRSPAPPRPGARRRGVRPMHKRLSLEMGGKNAQIVLDDADLDLALEGVLWGAFGTTGQRCTATSRLVLQRASTTSSSERLAERARALEARRRPQRAPTSARSSTRRRAPRSSATSRSAGGGRDARHRRRARRRRGARPRPLLRADDLHRREARQRLEQEEIFGPVLSVIRVETRTRRSGSTTA